MGAPLCACRPPPRASRRRQTTTPTSPWNEAEPCPPTATSHTRTAGPPPDPVLSLNHRGPYPCPRSQAPTPRLPPPPPPPRAERGLRREAWRQSGRGHDRGIRLGRLSEFLTYDSSVPFIFLS
ncbi:hypothetical protein CapIbe_000119 [Capra ibex]